MNDRTRFESNAVPHVHQRPLAAARRSSLQLSDRATAIVASRPSSLDATGGLRLLNVVESGH